MTKIGQGFSVAETHQNAATTPLLKAPQNQQPPTSLSRCDNAVTHSECHAPVTRDPRPVPVPGIYSPTAGR